MEYKILREEAFASVFDLNADFEYQGKKYQVHCTYINGDGLEDIEVFNEDDSCVENDFLEEKLLEMGKEILQDMDIDKHFTQY
jgi:hypothetical protein